MLKLVASRTHYKKLLENMDSEKGMIVGDLWVDWCDTHEQVIMNTWFQHHQRHLYTWKSPGDGVRNQIDYITLNKRFRNAIT